ncbi:hypothetical protein XENORESO_003075 [Xenotaenia resolanae]|uniref:BED-type domain-containing protein n=1 Tax=Xenotaenia resolanae TaxID=208358 RepID=A0ABV0VVC7_9TELE
MLDMNTALHPQERNDISSYSQQSMADRMHSKVWLHFSKCDADYARCNICDTKCKTSGGNTSNLRKHLDLLGACLLQQTTWLGFNLCIILESQLNVFMLKKCLKQLRCYNTNSWMLLCYIH